MIFAMSDFHGHFGPMNDRIAQIRPFLEEQETAKLVLLGDYIDRGGCSYQCLKLAYDLQSEFGKEKVIVLKGNHEEWFLEFLFKDEDVWLKEDENLETSRTFLEEGQLSELKKLEYSRDEYYSYLKECIKNNHGELLDWTSKLPLFHETPTQIFVHAGVDEDISPDEIAYCALATPDYILLGKKPASIGRFYKDVIAGHLSAASVARNFHLKGIYFDGQSHYYIDGCTPKTKRVLCLAYDEEKGEYFEFLQDGSFAAIR